uniref:Receptor-like serine/threonine-protein kinase n=1 Tax=Kalanchoe fedtschenkoi TaxID=63787 RepID=A0A7N0TQN3_KALFE
MMGSRFTAAAIAIFLLINQCHAATFTNLTRSQTLRDGDFLTSSDPVFILGFFSPPNSTARYLGVWYNNIPTQTIVWVANRDKPVSPGSRGLLAFSDDGNLVVSDSEGALYWSSNATLPSNRTAAILSDAGNLVLSDTDTGRMRWQSFDHPTDTYLPGMEVLVNRQMGVNRLFSSWKSADDPSPGRYTMGVDPRGSPQIVVWDELVNRRWRSGHWNGLQFVGVPNMTANYLYGFKLSNDEGDGNMYFTYTPSNTSTLFRFLITADGIEELLVWDDGTQKWDVAQSQPDTECDFYNKCGKFATCGGSQGTSQCSCLRGYEPEDEEEWRKGNWSMGCVRSTPLQCEGNSSMTGGSDGFVETRNVKLPDFADSVQGISGNDACREQCLMNCSCKGYVMTTGLGCFIWTQDLVDIRQFSDASGKTLHVRLAGSELASSNKVNLSKLAIIGIVLAVIVVLVLLACFLFTIRRKLKGSATKNNAVLTHTLSKSCELVAGFPVQESITGESQDGNGVEVPLLQFDTIAVATNNFSKENKLGQGGFGPVYMGKLPSGQEVAVKRLSVKSGQGFEEFKNEIILISKLQHRNLVRLLGWCMQDEEKMLIYEYMPNKSLDFFLFDPAKRSELHWNTRFNIIEGIARGLLYLHRDSRLRIIHRDLKASNILLDGEMNPKISDFGMARIFGGNQNEANTTRVVGTYGYMSPEYAMEGLFSVKSDVYSFGVLLLEIISGRRNTSFHLTENPNLIRYAWSLWTEGKAIELIDPSIKDSGALDQVLRCIHIGMLCVQDSAAHRPNMSTIIIMLESETPLPAPKPTTFGSTSSSTEILWSTSKGLETVSSSNELTIITEVSGR